jgi:MFS family permease
MRRLMRTVRILLAFESAMYTAVTPLLPHYARVLHASTAEIGLLTAAYSVGLIPGSLLGGWLSARCGVRRTTLTGLIGFGLAVIGFAVAPDLLALDLLRLVQGVFCGLIWGGGLTWVIAQAPVHRRGAAIGGAIGAATIGTMLGPVLGTLAILMGTVPVFGATGAVAIALAGWTWTLPEPTARPGAGAILRQLRSALGAGGFALGAWLITLEAILFGATTALLPLRMAHFGAPGWAVGAAFVAASGLSALLAPLVGRCIDRRGALATVAMGLSAGAPLVAALALPHDAFALGVVIVLALGGPMTAGLIPAVSMMTEATERVGVTLLLATTMVNLAYAAGEVIGAPAAAGLSESTGDAIPLLIIAGLLLATLVPVLRARRAATAQPSAGAPAASRRHSTPQPALHRGRGTTARDPERRHLSRDRRRADRADRTSPVRLGSVPPPLRGDTADPGDRPGGAAERRRHPA